MIVSITSHTAKRITFENKCTKRAKENGEWRPKVICKYLQMCRPSSAKINLV